MMKKFIMIIMLVLMATLVFAADIDLSSETSLPYLTGSKGYCFGVDVAPNGECWTDLDFDKDGYEDSFVVCRNGDNTCINEVAYDYSLIKITLSKGDPIALSDGVNGVDGIYFYPEDINGDPISLLSTLTLHNVQTPVSTYFADEDYEAFPESPNEVLAYVTFDPVSTISPPGRIAPHKIIFYTTDYTSNEAPVINSITPSERTELTVGDTQLYTADVSDEDTLTYSWSLDGVEVSNEETYYADWAFLTPGIYTLTLEVSDGEFTDSTSSTLEIRAKGGSGGGSFSIISGNVVVEEVEETEPEIIFTDLSEDTSTKSPITIFFSKIGNFFRGLFG